MRDDSVIVVWDSFPGLSCWMRRWLFTGLYKAWKSSHATHFMGSDVCLNLPLVTKNGSLYIQEKQPFKRIGSKRLKCFQKAISRL
ncbi:hypothetical protein MKW98_030203 [Papaver atlanticum]|uniref:Uncharacterized protein n=1 Tax=Papaver atlanticum TaxID=357466 RepID=A0AAD4XJH6_9MAGN|nr:hypothetical protein MKW98_030203 [Papaver atlanticum]